MGMNAARWDGGVCDWVQAHEALCRHARERAAADADEGRWLLAAWRSGAHVHLGCASFSEYVERVLGYKPRTTREKLRVAEALEGLPRLAQALEAGALKWCAVREITRVATPDTEHAWLEASQNKTTSQLEELVAGKDPGDLPQTSTPARPRARVLRFEVAPETFALFGEAMRRLRRSFGGGGLDDDAALLSMARHVLGGPEDEGRSPYQISLSICAACRSGAQLASGDSVPVGAEVVAMAECDGQHIGQLLPRAANGNAEGATHTARANMGRTANDQRNVNEPGDADEHRPADERLVADSAGDVEDRSVVDALRHASERDAGAHPQNDAGWTHPDADGELGVRVAQRTRPDHAHANQSNAPRTPSDGDGELGVRVAQRTRPDRAHASQSDAPRTPSDADANGVRGENVAQRTRPDHAHASQGDAPRTPSDADGERGENVAQRTRSDQAHASQSNAARTCTGADGELGVTARDIRQEQVHAARNAETAPGADGEGFGKRAFARAVDAAGPPRSPSPGSARTRARATQSVPPALRRAILARDQGRCRVPGCRHGSFVDVHHIVPRSEGGSNETDNLLTICGGHHRSTHRGELVIERERDGSLCFRHADGSVYGSAVGPSVAPELMDSYAKVFSALRHLRFREREIRAVLAELRSDAALRNASLERLLREGLRRIRVSPA